MKDTTIAAAALSFATAFPAMADDVFFSYVKIVPEMSNSIIATSECISKAIEDATGVMPKILYSFKVTGDFYECVD